MTGGMGFAFTLHESLVGFPVALTPTCPSLLLAFGSLSLSTAFRQDCGSALPARCHRPFHPSINLTAGVNWRTSMDCRTDRISSSKRSTSA